ncbi:hypothetical protein N7448_002200 [Penicillium atrosanguineum]|uniref:Uncharacterized protein n=1 Tax=Penicillium atrosanguineum TaxID=1132637 RepID=A0A9W9U358_9EURO|nr:hypothetical protein N7526_006646 [Penicillium atrosanguineum]KAJ5144808.1 hypothetical protein N7448_002200 [Penicillium atrosanguineum]KAJ5311243.1 hypothetical protein N7476_007103 [Penicillium atrosanguineum]
MSQPTQRSQSPLAAPAEILAPATPAKRATLSPSPDLSAAINRSSQSDKKFLSPPPLSSSDMTPPPSTQIPGAPLRRSHSRSLSPSLITPVDLGKSLCDAYGASENLPTAEDIDNANETQLRIIAKDLLAVAQESRMSALHFKLQNSLVSFASNEAVKRAEVEHQLAKREVEILQSAEYRSRSRPAEPITPKQSFSADDYTTAVQRSQDLENVNAVLDRRLRNAKRAIDDAAAQTAELTDQNSMLKKRIEENRRHFSQIYSYGCLSPGMQNELHTICRGEHTDGLAALLFADKFTNHIHEPQGSYGAPSSAPVTPNHPRSVRQDRSFMTSARNNQYDSDSTVSLSGEEVDEEMRHPQVRTTAPRTSTLLQTKLFGQVKKPGVSRPQAHKRKASSEEDGSVKRSRKGAVGLGIHS